LLTVVDPWPSRNIVSLQVVLSLAHGCGPRDLVAISYPCRELYPLLTVVDPWPSRNIVPVQVVLSLAHGCGPMA